MFFFGASREQQTCKDALETAGVEELKVDHVVDCGGLSVCDGALHHGS